MSDGDGGAALPEPVVTDLLADRRRRYALDCLLRHASPVSLATLADCVTERELGGPPEDVPRARLRVYMSLYHDHRPVLEEAGVATYCQEEDVMTVTAATEQLKPHLERADEGDSPPDGSERERE